MIVGTNWPFSIFTIGQESGPRIIVGFFFFFFWQWLLNLEKRKRESRKKIQDIASESIGNKMAFNKEALIVSF